MARQREVVITSCQEGPYLIRGPIRMIDEAGQEVLIRRRVVALCRCGRSTTKPFCDGTHKVRSVRAAREAGGGW